MSLPKRKAVFVAQPEQLEQIQEMVRNGRYRSSSAFLREAIDEKLERLRRELLCEQVERYCASGHAGDDDDLIKAQAFESNE